MEMTLLEAMFSAPFVQHALVSWLLVYVDATWRVVSRRSELGADPILLTFYRDADKLKRVIELEKAE